MEDLQRQVGELVGADCRQRHTVTYLGGLGLTEIDVGLHVPEAGKLVDWRHGPPLTKRRRRQL